MLLTQCFCEEFFWERTPFVPTINTNSQKKGIVDFFSACTRQKVVFMEIFAQKHFNFEWME